MQYYGILSRLNRES